MKTEFKHGTRGEFTTKEGKVCACVVTGTMGPGLLVVDYVLDETKFRGAIIGADTFRADHETPEVARLLDEVRAQLLVEFRASLEGMKRGEKLAAGWPEIKHLCATMQGAMRRGIASLEDREYRRRRH